MGVGDSFGPVSKEWIGALVRMFMTVIMVVIMVVVVRMVLPTVVVAFIMRVFLFKCVRVAVSMTSVIVTSMAMMPKTCHSDQVDRQSHTTD